MNSLTKMTMAVFAAAFLASSPVLAADAAAPAATPAAEAAKPDIAGGLKQKAAEMIEQGQKKADGAASKLENTLGVKKENPADATKSAAASKVEGAKTDAANAGKEVVDIQQETVTVQTPQGTAQETTTVIVPEGAAKK